MRPKIEDAAKRVALSTTVAPVTDRRIKASCKRMNLSKGQLIDRLMEPRRK